MFLSREIPSVADVKSRLRNTKDRVFDTIHQIQDKVHPIGRMRFSKPSAIALGVGLVLIVAAAGVTTGAVSVDADYNIPGKVVSQNSFAETSWRAQNQRRAQELAIDMQADTYTQRCFNARFPWDRRRYLRLQEVKVYTGSYNDQTEGQQAVQDPNYQRVIVNAVNQNDYAGRFFGFQNRTVTYGGDIRLSKGFTQYDNPMPQIREAFETSAYPPFDPNNPWVQKRVLVLTPNKNTPREQYTFNPNSGGYLGGIAVATLDGNLIRNNSSTFSEFETHEIQVHGNGISVEVPHDPSDTKTVNTEDHSLLFNGQPKRPSEYDLSQICEPGNPDPKPVPLGPPAPGMSRDERIPVIVRGNNYSP